MNNAVKDGGEKLQGFAKVSGMSGQEFAETWKKDPYAAVQAFEKGLANQNKEGQNVKAMLKELGITELRETDTVLRLANGNKQLQTARENANKGYKEGNALSKEAETKYKTLGNQMKIFMNHVRDLGIEIGSALSPILIGMMKVLTPVIDALAKAPAPIKLMVVALGLIPIVAVPVLASLAGITGAMGLMGQAMNTATAAAGRNSKALRVYSIAMGLLTNPIKTTRKGLASLPGIFGKVGKSAQSGAKATSSTGTVLAKTGGQAAKSGSLFGKFASKLKFLAPIGSMLTGVMSTLLTALAALSAPVIIAVTVIGSLVAAFVVAYKKVGWFRDGINGLLYVFKVFGGNIISGAINKVKEFGKWVGDVAGSVGGWAVDKFKSLWKAMSGTSYGKATKKNFNSFKKGMQELGKASQKSTDQVKVLGKGVSEGTKKALGGYVKYSQKSTEIMAQMRLNNGKESEKLKNALINNSKSAGEELVKQLKKRNQDNVSQLQKMLSDTKVYTGKEADEIVSRAKKAGDEKVKKTEKLNKEIKELESKALADGKLSESERKAIQKKYDERNKIAVETLSKGQKEQRAILSRLDTNVGAINTKEAQDAIKEVIEAQDKAIADAKKKRNKLITEADDALANGTITQKEHDNIVKKVQSQYDTETGEAIKKGKESKKKIKKASPGIEELVNMDSGKSYSKAQQWWNQFSGFMSTIGGQTIKDWGNIFKNIWNANVKFGEWIGQGFSNLGGWFSQQGQEFSTAFKNGWKIASQAGGDLWGWIKNTGAGIGGWFSSQGQEFANRFKQGWQIASQAGADLWSWIKQTGGSIGGWFAQKGRDFWNSLKNAWGALINSNPGAMWTSLTSALGTAWAATKQWFITKGQQMGSALSQGWAAMKGFVVNTFGSIWTFVKSIWQGIWSTISYWSGAIWNRVKSVWSWIKNNTTLVFTSVWNFIKWIWTSIKNTVVYWTGAIWNRVKAVWTWIKNNTVNAFTGVWNTVKRIWAAIKNTIVYWTTLIWNRVKSVWNWIKSNTVGAFTYVWNTIKRIWSGIKNTVVYWTQAVWNRVKAVWSWIKSNTLNAFNYVWNTIKRIWNGIKGTIVYWTTAIWNRVKSVWNWIKSNTASAFTWVWNKIKSIWNGIKGTIVYWTGAIWNRVKAVWNWIKSNTASAFNWVWNKLKSIWKGIKGTITYWTNAVWNKIKSIWNSIKSHTYDIFNAIWNKLKSIWNSIFGTIKYWMNEIWTKVKNGWNSIKKHTVDMVTKAKDAVVDKFTGMYNGAKEWIDKIGSYIDDAKKWMKDKAISLGKSVANGAISGLNKMIGGINKISKAITSKKLMDEIPELSTGTGKGKPKANSKGQLRKPTTAIVNDKGQGNGRGPNGHQEIIQKSNGQMFAPKGKNVVVGLEKGDIVHSGQDTQAMQSQGIIPHFRKGTKKKKKNGVLDALGGASKGVSDKLSDGYHSSKKASKDAMDTVKEGGAKVLEKGKDAASWLGDKIGDVWAYVKNPGKLVEKVIGHIGFGKENKTMEMAGLAFKHLKKSLVDKVKSWFEEAEGGDGDASWLLKHKILQTFGHYTGGLMFNGGRHYGMDFAMPTGTKIRALTSGKISQAGPVSGGGGNQITLDEPGGKWYQWYMHMSKIIAKKGQKVNAGDVIGLSGNTGNSTTPHLHIQRMKGYPSNATAVDPMKWLKSLKGGGKNSSPKAVQAWKPEVKQALGLAGLPQTSAYINAWLRQINTESTGNPKAVGPGSSEGNPKGLVQVKPGTFNAYKLGGHGNIFNGLDNLIAGMRYAKARYGKSGMLSRIGVGGPYANGGLVTKHQVAEIGEGNKPEMVIPLTRKARAMQLIDQAKSFMGVDDEGSISTVDNNSSDDIVTQLLQQNNRLLEALINTVENKDLTVDKQAIIDTANTGMARKYKDRSYIRGGR